MPDFKSATVLENDSVIKDECNGWISDINLPVRCPRATHNRASIGIAELICVGLISLLIVVLVQDSKSQLSKLEAMMLHFNTVDILYVYTL